MKPLVPMPESKFIRVACKKCKNTQTIFNRPSTVVRCVKCGDEIAKPTGGEVKIKAKVLEVLG